MMQPELIGTFAATAKDGQRCSVHVWMTFRRIAGTLVGPAPRWVPERHPSMTTEGGHEVRPVAGEPDRFFACGPDLALSSDAPTLGLFGTFDSIRQARSARPGGAAVEETAQA